jgi:hypothetical protein
MKSKNKKLLRLTWKAIGIANLAWVLFWFVKVKILNEYGLVSNVMKLAIGTGCFIVYLIITIVFLLIKSKKKKK